MREGFFHEVRWRIYVHILVTRKKKQELYVSSRFPVYSSTLNYVYSLNDVPTPQHVAYFSSFLNFIINIIQVLDIGFIPSRPLFISYILLKYMSNYSILEIHWIHMNMKNTYHYLKYTFYVFCPVLIMSFHAFFINVFALKLY